MEKNIKSQGFTLIELSIVLIIISLIVGGVVGGRSLIHSANLNSIISEVNSYKLAVQQYEDYYDKLPGDHNDAQSYWPAPQCVDEATNPCNGDGDGEISSNFEDLRAWQHLSLAGMINENFDGLRAGVSGTRNPGINVPKSDSGWGGYIIYKLSGDWGATDFTNGTINVITSGNTGCGSYMGCGVITGPDAKLIDKKTDDGKAGTGFVKGAGDWNNGWCLTGGEYDLTMKDKYCKLGFFF